MDFLTGFSGGVTLLLTLRDGHIETGDATMDDADRLFRPHKMDLGTAAMLAAYEAVRAMPDDTRPHTLDRVRYHAAKRAQTAERTRAAVDDGLENLAEIHQKAYERNSEALRDLVPARAWSRLGLDA